MWVGMHVCVCVTYSLKTDSSGDGVYDCICMRKIREPAGLNALEVHSLKTEIIPHAVNDKLPSPDKIETRYLCTRYQHAI